ncbi:hypothetical protein [Pantoea allii]|nr:hypothetical protein [Pantoea allii]MCH9296287.1 hypothetical protein [Pantoea allii]
MFAPLNIYHTRFNHIKKQQGNDAMPTRYQTQAPLLSNVMLVEVSAP